MEEGKLELRIYPPFGSGDREELGAFLGRAGLAFEPTVEYGLILRSPSGIVGTASLEGSILKCMAVDPAERGGGVALTLVTEIAAEAARRGRPRLFAYTPPENEALFRAMGFDLVAALPAEVALFERGVEGIGDFLARSASGLPSAEDIAASVVNCNPFTLGHRRLIETAASRSELVLVFVVEEDRSVFPFEGRFRLVREGLADLGNVRVLPTGPYMVSAATFPSYFLKEPGKAASLYARLDATVFGSRIAPVLGIKRRFVGEEPYCETTAAYNRAMKEILPGFGIQVVEIPRLALGGVAVSASTVRSKLAAGRLEEALELVPQVTRDYLASSEAAPILARLAEAARKGEAARH